MNNEEVRLECSPKLVKGHSEVNCAHPPLRIGSHWGHIPVCKDRLTLGTHPSVAHLSM